MRIRALSVDLGWKHLAYAILDIGNAENDENHDDFNILAWDCHNLLSEANINVNEASLDELIRLTVPSVALIIDVWTKWKPTIAFLEQQPLGMHARNVKSKTLSHVLQGLLLSKGIPVVFVSPQKKLKYMEQTGNVANYSANKKFAVDETTRLLMSLRGDNENNAWLLHFQSFKKKDDLADSLLQGLYASKDALLDQLKEMKRTDLEPQRKKKKVDKKKSRKAAQLAVELDDI